MHARRKGIEPADAMGEAVLDQEIQRAIGNRRLCAEALGRKPIQHIIRAQRAMLFKKDFQHAAAHRRQAQALFGNAAVRFGQHTGFAARMVMIVKDVEVSGHRLLRFVITLHIGDIEFRTQPQGTPMLRLAFTLCLLAVPARADGPVVATDIPPVQSLVSMVMGEVGAPSVLSPGDPHNRQLRPSEARALADADLIVWVGPALAPWLGDATQRIAPDAVSLELLETDGTAERAPMFGEDHDTHDDHDDHAAEEDHDNHGHDHGDEDPHAWLDPINGTVWLGHIATALAELDPENADTYRANAVQGTIDLTEVVGDVETMLAERALPSILVQHDAFAHFAARFDVPIVGTIADSDAAAPGGAEVSRLAARIAAGEIGCILTERGTQDALAERLGAEGALPVVSVDLLGLEADDYGSLMRNLATAITACAG